jgi:predicted amidohydrolase YtcJ
VADERAGRRAQGPAAVVQDLGGKTMLPGYHGRTYEGRFRIGGIKLTLDGSPQGKTAWLAKPYLVPPAGSTRSTA